MSKDATASPSRVKDNNTVLYPPNVAVKTEFCCFVVPEKSIDFVFLSITWIDAHHDAVFCLTHLFSRQGQHLHERLLLIQPSHIHTQKYHKEWFLLSSKQSGQQGSSSNWRTTSHLLYCTFTQKKKEMGDSVSVFFFYFYTFLGTVFCWDLALWATKWEVCNPRVSQRLACRDGRRGGVRKSEGGLDGVKETEMWRESEEEVKKRVGGRKRRRGAFRRWLKRRERDTNWWGEGRGSGGCKWMKDKKMKREMLHLDDGLSKSFNTEPSAFSVIIVT